MEIEGGATIMYAYPAGGSTGDDDAFVAMCERYRTRLVAFCGRRLRTSHDAEDAAHEALLRAHRGLAAFDDSSDAWPWLRTIAARVCADIQRRAARMPAPALLERHAEDDVHEQVVGRLRADILEDALEQLPPRYRMPLLLKEYGGWSYDDIARTQGKSLASVRSTLTRSRRRLGTHVESVARERGQWPLPGVVPPMQRLRTHLRSWREGLGRSGHAMMNVLELSSVTARWIIGANATLAGMLGLTTAASASIPALLLPTSATSSHPPVTRNLDTKHHTTLEASAASAAGAAVVTMTPSDRETLTRLNTTTSATATVDPGFEASGSLTVSSNEHHLFIGTEEQTTIPGQDGGRTRLSVPCTPTEANVLVCSTVRTVLPYVQGD